MRSKCVPWRFLYVPQEEHCGCMDDICCVHSVVVWGVPPIPLSHATQKLSQCAHIHHTPPNHPSGVKCPVCDINQQLPLCRWVVNSCSPVQRQFTPVRDLW